MKLHSILAVLVSTQVPVAICSALQQSLSSMSQVHGHVKNVHKAVESYNGGIMDLVKLSYASNNLDRAIDEAMQHNSQREPLDADEFEHYSKSFDEFHPAVVETMRALGRKASHFKSTGSKTGNRIVIQAIKQRQEEFLDSIRKSVHEDNVTALDTGCEDIDSAFRDTYDEFWL
ncbi:cell wall mannoprotein 1 family protein [Aspergillus candidus]|uniref:Hydrophobic surface binding protein A-domain-containing protein n=1 Tax=Aspergillus candidus TaxID=41067 RepID=A0A2I2F6W7_ASPCN|nr:hypothetical protein BDW47DRAFT_127356 [Aspergillus candidus]PLB36393.1 hypothetical protein BDW47DRAFT_127356 [Aspergillus candidus]